MPRKGSATIDRQAHKTDGRDPVVGVRLPPGLIKKIDRRAKQCGLFRSETIRRLLESGLKMEQSAAGAERRRTDVPS